MINRSMLPSLLLMSTLTLGLFGCTPEEVTPETTETAEIVSPEQQLKEKVEAVLLGSSDIPGSAINVAVDDGVVKLSGSLACENCGGLRTPGGIDTIQQSIGAVVRAVPGVEKIEFDLQN